METKPTIKIAVIGCLHGKLQEVYNKVAQEEKEKGIKIELVLIAGDFQSMRTKEDLQYIKVRDKYLDMGEFHLYYSGKLKVPYLTVFIGGNHEASNVLHSCFNGGWLCSGIFYLGRTGVINFKGVRIAGISGIFKPYDYNRGHYEKIENMKGDDKVSIFHIREFDIAKLNLIKEKVDIFLSHDWPLDVVDKMDFDKILKVKREWKEELQENQLGNPGIKYLLDTLRPKYWISAHMHFYYNRLITHTDKSTTRFIALDKIIPRRQWLDIIELEADKALENDNSIRFDPEWLSITKLMSKYIPLENKLYDFSNFMIKKGSYLHTSKIDEIYHKKNLTRVTPSGNFIEELNQLNKNSKINPSEKWKEIYNLEDQSKYLSLYYPTNELVRDHQEPKINSLVENTNRNDDEIDLDEEIMWS